MSIDNGDILSYGSPTITLGDFIPFYFGKKMPMLYVMKIGGNFVERPVDSKEIIYLKCSLIEVVKEQQEFYFTNGHATDHFTSFYDKDRINELVNIIDWGAVATPYWGGNENLDLKRKKQSEFLVGSDISPDLISGFGCYDEYSKQTLIDLGAEQNKIRVIPNEYY
ncbi:DUF4433 domain-containing protein [Flavobacterium sp.]|uniref:DUF4433 domain-containing protein n=1 Tax=Flavobacterium sp. TaxID=239 RepID=UPI0040338466